MKKFCLTTIEHSFDDVPWHGDGEAFRTMDECNRRIDALAQKRRDNEVSIIVSTIGGAAVKSVNLEPRLKEDSDKKAYLSEGLLDSVREVIEEMEDRAGGHEEEARKLQETAQYLRELLPK